MFNSNNRVVNKNGVYFYENDLIYNEDLFYNDLILQLKVDYVNNGLGFIISDKGFTSEVLKDAYLLLLTKDTYMIYQIHNGKQKLIRKGAQRLELPLISQIVQFKKYGKEISVVVGEETVIKEVMNRDMNSYGVGIYSVKGNTIKHATYLSNVPENWRINIDNTNGGKIQFYKDGFSISHCKQDAEVERQEIHLAKGKYYLNYTNKSIDSQNDIEAFIYYSKDTSFKDEDKKINNDSGMFELMEDSDINIKFRGRVGAIENIAIKDNPNDGYVSSSSELSSRDGSQMHVDLTNIKKIKWIGTVTKVPHPLTIDDKVEFSLVKTDQLSLNQTDLKVKIGTSSEYAYDTSTKELTVLTDGKTNRFVVGFSEPMLTIFHNINGYIDSVEVEYANGEKVDTLTQKTNEHYVPDYVKSPIIVCDDSYQPFDLSASYRMKNIDGETFYTFTNWEREVFSSELDTMAFEKAVRQASGSIIVYGIHPNASKDISKIYEIIAGSNGIEAYTKEFDIITEDLYEFDYEYGELDIDRDTKDQYEEFVVDYLKDDSYAINYVQDHKSYEVSVSTDREKHTVLYDYSDKNGAIEYANTGYKESSSKYIALSKEW